MISSPPGAARTLRGVFPGRLILILVLLIVASSAFEVMGCLDEERRALLDIKASMNEFDASALQDWGYSTLDDCCRWRGIACDPLTARVDKIDLYGEIWSIEKQETWKPNLTMLAEFRQLEVLNLGLNLMGGEIPPAVCDLKKLKILDLSFNKLTGRLPSCLCGLSALAELHLAVNGLQGVVPPCFGSFHSLTLLSLFENQFQGDYAPWVCSMQSLTQLQLSYDTNSGSIPACLENLHKLEYLKLGGRNLTGTIPSSIFHNLTNLGTLEINSNELEGTFKFSALANLSKLKEVDISSGEKFDVDTESPASWVPSFQLSFLSIRYCTVNNFTGRSVPTFLWGQRAMKILFLRDASITGTPPIGLFCNSSLGSLDLRSNNISGLLDVPCRNASDSAYEINLSKNSIYGPLPESIALSFPKLNILRIAENKLEGQIPPSLANRQLVLIDLSTNRLSGELPHAFTRNQSLLFYLRLAYNDLQGELLPVDAFMPKLSVLIVNNNRFTGSLLSKLGNSSLLYILSAGENHFIENFSQGLPLLPYMSIFSMKKNRIEGYIPRTFCQMQNIRMLDLSENNLSGEIPPCLQNISSWNSSISQKSSIWIDSGIADPLVKFISKKVPLPYTSDVLYMMTILDLSSNKIHGVIPWEIGELKGLRSLNLSINQIQGSIPISIANMDKLESLDLSHNRLSGTIPKEMVQLNSLSYLSLAFNNLSGTIPYIKQLSTFDEENFEGNPRLCGRPLKKDCSFNVEITNATRNDTRRLEDVLFYTFCVLLFTLGFWGYLACLFFSLRWRMKYFKVIDGFYDMYLRNLL